MKIFKCTWRTTRRSRRLRRRRPRARGPDRSISRASQVKGLAPEMTLRAAYLFTHRYMTMCSFKLLQAMSVRPVSYSCKKQLPHLGLRQPTHSIPVLELLSIVIAVECKRAEGAAGHDGHDGRRGCNGLHRTSLQAASDCCFQLEWARIVGRF